MNIGIIVYSQTGHTLSVAQRLKEKLIAIGHSVTLEQITIMAQDKSSPGKVVLKTIPDPRAYDVLIFGAQVQAFSLSQAMKAYLQQLPTLQGKKVGCLITQQLRFPWLGGNKAINSMKKAITTKGGIVGEAGIVHWSHKEREKLIDDLIAKLSKV